MKSALLLAFFYLAAVSGCKSQSNADLASDSGKVVQLNKNSPMLDIVGSWKGIGSISIVDKKISFSNCENAIVTIRAVSANHFSLKDQFTCDRGATVFTSGISQFDIAGQAVYLKGEPVGSITAGNINMHFLQGIAEVQLILTVNQNRLHYEFLSQSSGAYSSASADLVQ